MSRGRRLRCGSHMRYLRPIITPKGKTASSHPRRHRLCDWACRFGIRGSTLVRIAQSVRSGQAVERGADEPRYYLPCHPPGRGSEEPAVGRRSRASAWRDDRPQAGRHLGSVRDRHRPAASAARRSEGNRGDQPRPPGKACLERGLLERPGLAVRRRRFEGLDEDRKREGSDAARDRLRRLGDSESLRFRRPHHQPGLDHQRRHVELVRRRLRARHLRGRNCGGRLARLHGRSAQCPARVDRRDEQPGHGAHERRDRRLRLDHPAQGPGQHPRRQLLASFDGSGERLLGSARCCGREALVRRHHRRHRGRQQRHRQHPERPPQRARQRPLRDYRRRRRPRQLRRDGRRHRCAVVGLGPHVRRLREA